MSGIALGACLGIAACTGGGTALPEDPAAPPPQQALDDGEAVIEDEPALDVPASLPRSSPPPSMASPSGDTVAATALPRTPLSTSGPETTAEQVWGEVIGGNVGAAQSCGASASKVEAYRDRAQRYLVLRHMGSTLPGDYSLAYEDARRKSASTARGPDECVEILAALDR